MSSQTCEAQPRTRFASVFFSGASGSARRPSSIRYSSRSFGSSSISKLDRISSSCGSMGLQIGVSLIWRYIGARARIGDAALAASPARLARFAAPGRAQVLRLERVGRRFLGAFGRRLGGGPLRQSSTTAARRSNGRLPSAPATWPPEPCSRGAAAARSRKVGPHRRGHAVTCLAHRRKIEDHPDDGEDAQNGKHRNSDRAAPDAKGYRITPRDAAA